MDKKALTVTAVGDIFLGDYTISLNFGVRSTIEKYENIFLFENVTESLKGSDIVFANLETVLSDADLDNKRVLSRACRGKPEFVDILKKGGFNMVNIANNHILQHGRRAFDETIDILEKNKIDAVGLKTEGDDGCLPIIKRVGEIDVGFLGFCFCPELYHKGEIPYMLGSNKQIFRDIELLKKRVDYVFVSAHWGMEFIDRPSSNIRRLAREMVDSGADVIFGHHPHVVQGIENYNGSLIFYSLGNFVFDLSWMKDTLISMIAKVFVDSEKNIRYEIIPVGITESYQPILLNSEESDSFKQYVGDLSKALREDPIDEDFEDLRYEYYREVMKIYKRDQYLKALYIFKNFYRLNRIVYIYLIRKLIDYTKDIVRELFKQR